MGFNGKSTVCDTTFMLVMVVTVKLWFYADFIQSLENVTTYKLQFCKTTLHPQIFGILWNNGVIVFKQRVFFLQYKHSKWAEIFLVFATSFLISKQVFWLILDKAKLNFLWVIISEFVAITTLVNTIDQNAI